MKIQLIPISATGRRPGILLSPTSITIHSPGNPNSTAQNEADNVCFNNPEKQTSFHFVVDDKQVIQVLPTSEVAWHAGDGFNGKGNRTSIGVEICEGGDRKLSLHNALTLVRSLMTELGVSKVVQHRYWSGKICPRILINPFYVKGGMDWQWFMSELEKNMTKEEAKKIVKAKAGLSDSTIQYIADDYRYGDDLIIKLAKAMEGK